MNDGRISLLVGITGHRDLKEMDLPHLRRKVTEILIALRNHHSHTPIALLTSLAEGADRLVASVALELKMGLIVPLPMESEDYQLDFKTQASRKEFIDLLGKADSHFIASEAPGEPAEKNPKEIRSWLYFRAGAYIARHCHILLALWDGNPGEKTGGTSQIVHLKRQGLPKARSNADEVLYSPESGMVFHVVTPRESNPNLPGAFEIHPSYPPPKSKNKSELQIAFYPLLQRADDFNNDVISLRKRDKAMIAKSLSRFLPEAEQRKLSPGLSKLSEQFAAADALAILFQQKRHSALKWLCFLIVPISLFLAAYHTVGPDEISEPIFWLTGFWMSVAAAAAIFYRAQKGLFETKHLDYRALAEGLRVLFFWRLAGINDDIGEQYLRKHLSEVQWVRLAIRASEPPPSPTGNDLDVKNCVSRYWMINQLDYFKVAAPKHQQLAESHERWARNLLVGGLAFASLLLGVHVGCGILGVPLSPGLHEMAHVCSLLLVTLLAGAGAVATLAEKMAFTQLSKQYDPMARLFEVAADKYEKCPGPEALGQAHMIMRRLGHDSLRESADWVLLHRERPMEIKFG